MTFDVHDLEVMSRFWALALDYEEEPPPQGFSSWEEFADRNKIPPELWRAAVVDPERKRPRLFFSPSRRARRRRTGCTSTSGPAPAWRAKLADSGPGSTPSG